MAAPSGRAGHNRRSAPYDVDDVGAAEARLTALEHSMGVVQHGVAALDEIVPTEIQNIHSRLTALEQLASHFPTTEWCRVVDARLGAADASRKMQYEHLLLKIREVQQAVCQTEKSWILKIWERVKQSVINGCRRRSKPEKPE